MIEWLAEIGHSNWYLGLLAAGSIFSMGWDARLIYDAHRRYQRKVKQALKELEEESY